MYWRRTCCVALSGLFLATATRADVLPSDGMPFYRGKIEMSIQRLPPGMVLLYLPYYRSTSTKVAEKETLTIREPGTLYVADKALAAGGAVNIKKDQMYQLKHFNKFDFPVSRFSPDPIQHLTCAVIGGAASEYKLSCTDKTK